MFKIKHNENGTFQMFKACMVGKGFHQRLGVDFGETFSLVIKASTVGVVLSLADTKNCDIWYVPSHNQIIDCLTKGLT